MTTTRRRARQLAADPTPPGDARRRGIRTLLWALLALVAGIPACAAAFGVEAQVAAGIGAVCALFTSVVTVVVNALEDAGVVPALLKAPASSGEHPVPDERGQVSVGAVLIAIAIVVAALIIASNRI